MTTQSPIAEAEQARAVHSLIGKAISGSRVSLKSPYINTLLPVTYRQSLMILDLCVDGTIGWDAGLLALDGTWTLAELEALSVKLRYERDLSVVIRRTNSVSSTAAAGATHVSRHFNRTPDEAYTELTAKGFQIHETSTTNGGTARLSGSWDLYDLECLCVWLRYVAGENAIGAVEWLVDYDIAEMMKQEGQVPFSAYAREMLLGLYRAGANPAAFPRVYEKFKLHSQKGWSLPRIVCAANQQVYRDAQGQVQNVVIPSGRHHDQLMSKIIGLLGAVTSEVPALDPYVNSDQGFIDQHCNFYTREEAWTIATYHGQIAREPDGWPYGQLYSENLY